MSANTCILYANSLFESSDSSTNNSQLNAISDSGFTTVVLWAMHVNQNGDFSYNNTPMICSGQVSPGFNTQFGDLVSQLKNQSGGTVEKVIFSIGGSGVGDFNNIKNLLNNGQKAALLSNFAALMKLAPALDGFDFDLEETPYSDYAETVPQLTQLLYDNYGSMITYCPFKEESFWIDCLKSVATKNNGKQLVNWMNLQVYGNGASPNQWALDVQNSQGTGVTDGNEFITGGYSAQDSDPSSFCQNFTGLNVTGGFIWNLSFLGAYSPTQYAQAIINGLAKNCSE